MRDYYEILGVSRDAPQEEIKRAFYRLAHKYHPDKGGDAQKFKEANEAYQVLSSPEKRAQYDKFGRVFDGAGAGFEGFPGFEWQSSDFGSPFEFSFGGFDFNDIFADFFGRTSAKKKKNRYKGRDVEVNLEITLEEAAFGIKKDVSFKTYLTCEDCRGKGLASDSDLKNCPLCKGEGVVRESKRTIFGQFTQIIDCSKCRGRGKIPEKLCHVCGGDGRYYGLKNITIEVPWGIRDGETIRIKNEGETGILGEQAGDLHLRIIIKPHPVFESKGDDLFTTIYISFPETILGTKKEIKTLDKKKIVLKIPAGTQPGETFRIKGKGIKHFNAPGQGDLYVKVKIKIPKKVSPRIKELLEELQKETEEKE